MADKFERTISETVSEPLTAGIEYHGGEEFVLWAKNVDELEKVVDLFLKKIRKD